MDIFPRPDVAEGIFYEYLRYDAPISLDFRDHVVDGIPFLLAPLALVRNFPTVPEIAEMEPMGGSVGFYHFVMQAS